MDQLGGLDDKTREEVLRGWSEVEECLRGSIAEALEDGAQAGWADGGKDAVWVTEAFSRSACKQS
jgi:hypothetical protein